MGDRPRVPLPPAWQNSGSAFNWWRVLVPYCYPDTVTSVSAGGLGMDMFPSTLACLRIPAIASLCILVNACGGGGGSDDSAQISSSGSRQTQNTRPDVSGQPELQVSAGGFYSFTPSASDPDGDTLEFSISGLPSWATFDRDTGRLSGSPATGDVGTTSTVQVQVSDGTAVAALPPFTLTVNSARTGSATVSWTPPVSRADGTALALGEIAGYTIYYGTTPGAYPNNYNVQGGGATSATIDSLLPGTYYMVVTTRDSGGRLSSYSSEVVKVVSPAP